MSERHECPEFGCGIEMGREELNAHLQWDHNRTEWKAEQMLNRYVDTGISQEEGRR